jgi:hypothetical protein
MEVCTYLGHIFSQKTSDLQLTKFINMPPMDAKLKDREVNCSSSRWDLLCNAGDHHCLPVLSFIPQNGRGG